MPNFAIEFSGEVYSQQPYPKRIEDELRKVIDAKDAEYQFKKQSELDAAHLLIKQLLPGKNSPSIANPKSGSGQVKPNMTSF